MPEFLQWLQTAKQRMWMVLPLLPTAFNDSSPYSTQSAFGLNPLFIDLSQVPEFQELGGEKCLSAEQRGQLNEARAAERIQYQLVFPLKGAALRKSFDRFESEHFAKKTERAKAFQSYLDSDGHWLNSYALFAALSRERNGQPWWEWPEPLVKRQPEALAQAAQRLSLEIRFHSWMQWLAEVQWKRVRQLAKESQVQLCGDEPFIVGQDSVDCWANPTILRRDARLGVPPDAFSATGQDWGLPYFDFANMEKEDYAWLKARARKTATYFDLRRIDHAVGYFRQWIRDAQTPTGRFIPQDENAQKALGEKVFTLLEGMGVGIVAEDLGVIPDWVRQTLFRLGVPGYRVIRWERDNNVYRDPKQFPAASLVTTSTHDTDTLAEAWDSQNPQELEGQRAVYRELQALHPLPDRLTQPVHEALLAVAEGAGSDLCIIPWQDALGSRDRVNLPGTNSDANWSYRIHCASSELAADATAREAAQRMARLTQAAGRAP